MTNSILHHENQILETFDSLESHIKNAREIYSLNNFLDNDNPNFQEIKTVYRDYLLSIANSFNVFIKYYDALLEDLSSSK